MRLVTDAGIIVAKNNIMDKAVQLFSNLAGAYRERLEQYTHMPRHLVNPHPKISKGEKHEGMPWVMLDYPRHFNKDGGQFAIRTFFWWGHYFSIQLQLSHNFLPLFLPHLYPWLTTQPEDWYLGYTTDVWDQKLPNPAWLPVIEDGMPLPQPQTGQPVFLKLAKKIPIGEWESASTRLFQYFHSLAGLIESAYGAD